MIISVISEFSEPVYFLTGGVESGDDPFDYHQSPSGKVWTVQRSKMWWWVCPKLVHHYSYTPIPENLLIKPASAQFVEQHFSADSTTLSITDRFDHSIIENIPCYYCAEKSDPELDLFEESKRRSELEKRVEMADIIDAFKKDEKHCYQSSV